MADRAQRQENVDRAHEIQIQAAIRGAAWYTAFGVILAGIGHLAWPTFRQMRPAFKVYLVSGFTTFGAIVKADDALFKHQSEERRKETALRRQAIHDLASQGKVATEREIAMWKVENGKVSQR
ncbi:hypothetical protein SISSUDRAFT_985545 [Sistotremastrum suecicum HHB10207 ss-3]|uniref:HIG1 domain-containing protein n=1 Tax=Sistotremastrum suecicum HHB10207 ss-3 TaxID=1314776 RepID=A0A166DWC7_9AGAM|nr:hypothetical protein SISSUDRAFT_985545 [Sistotremastrum suecicum HHB10207 ss-3]